MVSDLNTSRDAPTSQTKTEPHVHNGCEQCASSASNQTDLLTALEALYAMWGAMWGERRDVFGDRHCLECGAVGDPDDSIPVPHETDCAFVAASAAIQKARGGK